MSMTREHELAPEQVSLRAAWEVIEEARGSKITGELAITTASSKTLVYLDSGSVYFAHGEGEETLANRLVEAGAITAEQLRRGAVRLNGVEHLGRLFERDVTVERDAVELALELMTEHALTEVAGQEVLSLQTTMYRQHSSGVVRWFAAPVVMTAPEVAAVVAEADADTDADAAVEDVVEAEADTTPKPIPTLPAATLLTPNRLAPRPPVNRLTQLVAAPLSLVPESPDDETIETVEEVVDEDEIVDEVDEVVEEVAVEEVVEEVVDEAVVEPAKASVVSVLHSLKPLTSLKSFMPITSRQPITQLEAAPSPTMITSEHDLAAMITDAVPLTAPYSTDSSADDHAATPIPEDVAAAVRRAIDAIETAMHKPRSVTSVSSVSFGPMHVTSLGHPTATAAPSATTTATPTPPPPPEPFMIMSLDAFGASSTEPISVFAKPTGAMVHPVLSFGELSSDGAVYPLPVLPPLPQRTPDASSDQRRGALRRLIAGIRRR